MEANAKSKARFVLRAALILGLAGTAAIAGACSSETSEEKKDAPITINLAANDPNVERPVDATPSPDGSDIYFIASTRVVDAEGLGFERQAAIYKVSAKGGAPQKLHQGAPLVSPFGITISDDGQTLFLADSGADTSEERSDGVVFSMSANGGTPSALAGTEGLAPGGIEVQGGSLFITGRKDGQAGLFKTGLAGGGVTPVAVGPQFTDPTGVAVAKNGDAYVVDSGSAVAGQAGGAVVKVGSDGKTEVVVEGLAVGHPAGIALSLDDKTVFVSAFDSGAGTDVVFAVDLASREVGTFTDKIADFTESAGLHRARNAEVYAWADSSANKTGTVYALSR